MPQERWKLFWQAISIGQHHGTFTSPYAGPKYSLQNYPEQVVSLTTTLFFGLRLGQNTQLYLNPEIAGGRRFSGVTGLANLSNGELPRVASAKPSCISRACTFPMISDLAIVRKRGEPAWRARRLTGFGSMQALTPTQFKLQSAKR